MNAVTILGFALVGAGLAFAFGTPGRVKAGGNALKSVSLEGPAWLIMVGIGAGTILFGAWMEQNRIVIDKTDETLPTAPPTTPPVDEPADEFDGPFTFGDDPDLDQLWNECDRGIWTACDDLYLQSPIGSDYEWFGATCGEVVPEPIDFCAVENREGS